MYITYTHTHLHIDVGEGIEKFAQIFIPEILNFVFKMDFFSFVLWFVHSISGV